MHGEKNRVIGLFEIGKIEKTKSEIVLMQKRVSFVDKSMTAVAT